MAASLSEIYKLLTEQNGKLGELTGIAKGLADKIEENERRASESVRRADESRANVHRRLDELVMRTTHLESDMSATKRKVDDMEKVTVAVTTLRSKAEGAGTLGRWLLKFGGWILGGASGLGLLYTWMTGRPPP